MRRTVLRLLAGLLLLGLGAAHRPVQADTPYTTWALGPGRGPILTQDAYTPYAEIDLPIEAAEDMFVTSEGVIYLADTGHGRVLELRDFEVTAEYGLGVLKGPTGVFVDRDGVMYVADAELNQVVILNPDGSLRTQFGRPTEPLFGRDREFLPRKLAVDVRRNIYLVSEGSVDGIVQMNAAGNFIGYFGANAASMSLKMILQRLFLTEEQLAQFVKNEAASPSNLAIDQQSLVYTLTAGTDPRQSIRKFNVAGRNIFPETFASSTMRDLHVSDTGLIVAVDANGQLFEYDLNGTVLFVFGAPDNGDQRLGTLRNPVAVARHGERLYVLDKDKNALVVYQTTAFAQKVHAGARLYTEGYYREARPFFEEVLDANGSYIMSYGAIANAHFKAGDYAQALTAFRYAEDQRGYSEAFWELRNAVLQRTLAPGLAGLAGLWLAWQAGAWLDRRRGWSQPARQWARRLLRFRLIDDLVFLFRFVRQPADSFYYIKHNLRGSLTFAGLLYAWVIGVWVLALYVTGFPFSAYPSPSFIRVENEILTVAGVLALWNAANYLVSTINDGEGRIRDVVIGTAYSLFPFALFALPIALISNVLTLNEQFVYSFSLNLVYAWTGLMLAVMVKEIHNYEFGETVRNLGLTLFTMALFLLTGYILYVLFNQLFDFILAIWQEVGLRG